MPRTLDTLVDLFHCETAASAEYIFVDRKLKQTDQIEMSEFKQRVFACANKFESSVLKGDVVLILFSYQKEFLTVLFALMSLGAIPVPLSVPSRGGWHRIQRIAADCGASKLITSSRFAAEANEQLSFLDVICFEHSEHILGICRRPGVLLSQDDVAFIQYTSGSTNEPKGVCLTHRQVLANLRKIETNFEISSSDVGVSWLPFYHDMGLIGHVFMPLYSGIRQVFLSPITMLQDPLNWLRVISFYKGTISGGPDFAYANCCQKEFQEHEQLDLSHWRIAYCGSDRIVRDTYTKFASKSANHGFNDRALYACYGLAETALFVCGRFGIKSIDFDGKNYVCVGKVDESVVICDDNNVEVLPGELGQILVDQDSNAKCYFGNEEESQSTFNVRVPSREGKYLATGDLGILIDDELYFVARKSNSFKHRGVTFFSSDIEYAAQSELGKRGNFRCIYLVSTFDRDLDPILLIEPLDSESKISLEKFTEEMLVTALRNAGYPVNQAAVVDKGTIKMTSSGKVSRSETLKAHR